MMLRRGLLGASAAMTLAACGGGIIRRDPRMEALGGHLPRLPGGRLKALADGRETSLSTLVAGRVAVVDFWATWCEACRPVSRSIGLLAKVHARTDLLVAAVAVGEDKDSVERFIAARPPQYPIYLDSELEVIGALGTKELPTVMVVDRYGQVRAVRAHVDMEVVRLVDDLLGVKAPEKQP
ncbi:MAG: TlpA disulfide reductase family protein [Polyangiaceae bacterium]